MINDDVIDVDYNENTDLKYIKGKPLYYKTAQVGSQLSESDSTVRFWCECFKDFLPIQTSGRNRMFTDGDIEKLKYIQKLLREDHLTISQVKEYCSEQDTSVIERKIKKADPIALQSLASALAIEIGTQLEEYKLQIKNELIAEMKEQFDEQNKLQNQNKLDIQEFIAITVKNELKENIQTEIKNQTNDIKIIVNNMEQEASRNLIEREDLLRHNMEERKLQQNQQEVIKQQKKGFFSKLFGK